MSGNMMDFIDARMRDIYEQPEITPQDLWRINEAHRLIEIGYAVIDATDVGILPAWMLPTQWGTAAGLWADHPDFDERWDR